MDLLVVSHELASSCEKFSLCTKLNVRTEECKDYSLKRKCTDSRHVLYADIVILHKS